MLKSSNGKPSTALMLNSEFGWTVANPPERKNSLRLVDGLMGKNQAQLNLIRHGLSISSAQKGCLDSCRARPQSHTSNLEGVHDELRVQLELALFPMYSA